MSAIFISHRRSDAAVAAELAEWLRSQGHRSLFLDFDPADGIAAGKDWEQELYREMRRCRAVIVICSTASMGSKWVFAEMAQARAQGKHILPVRVDDCIVDPLIADRQVIDMTNGRHDAYQRLERGLQVAGLDLNTTFDWDATRPPYPGLLAFQEDDAAVFFGRDPEITESLDLLNRVRRRRADEMVMILGASGSGKSSLLRAGIVPRLRLDTERWFVVDPFSPRDEPLRELSEALRRGFARIGVERERAAIREQLVATDSSVPSLVEITRELLMLSRRDEATVLLAVDQFEELLGGDAHGPGGRTLRMIADAVQDLTAPLVVVGTMRSDFLGRYQTDVALRDVRSDAFTLGPLSADGVTQIIERPAEISGLVLEPGLTSLMVDDTRTSDALPLLAFSLRELYDRFGDDGRLDVAEYRDGLGGIHGAVARVAEEMIESEQLDAAQMDNLRRAMLSIVRLSEDGGWTRRVSRWSELPASVHPVLERFVDARLLVSRSDGEDRTLEVAHEALFRSWHLLAGWLERDKEVLRLRGELGQAASTWVVGGRSAEDLWRGTRLARAQELRESGDLPLGAVEQEFLDSSEEAARAERTRADRRRRRRVQITATVAMVTSVLAVVALTFFVRARREAGRANEQATVAEEQAMLAEEQTALAEEQEALARDEARRAEVERLRADDAATAAEVGRVRALIPSDAALALAIAAEGHARYGTDATAGALVDAKTAVRASGLLTVLRGHHERVSDVVFSPDGTRIATASSDRTAKIWDAETGDELLTLAGHGGSVTSVGYNADGTRIATASGDGTGKVWDAETGDELLTLSGHDSTVSEIAYNPDGTRIATASGDGTAKIWDAETGDEVVAVTGHEPGAGGTPGTNITRTLNGVAWNDDGTAVATASFDGTARVWDASSGDELLRVSGELGIFDDVAFSPNGARLVTATTGGRTTIWDTESGEEIENFSQGGDIVSVSVGSAMGVRGILIATANTDGTARFWDVDGTEEFSLEGHGAAVTAAVFSRDGSRLATASSDGTARVWRVPDRGQLDDFSVDPSDPFGRFAGGVDDVAFDPSGTSVMMLHSDDAWVFDTTTGDAVLSRSGGRREPVAGWLGAGRVVFATHERSDEVVQISTVNLPTEVSRIPIELSEFVGAALGPDGTRLATIAIDPTNSTGLTVTIWDATTGTELHTLEPDPDTALLDIAFDPDGTHLATASADPATGTDTTVTLWDTTTGIRTETLTSEPDSDAGASLQRIVFDPDGTRLATIGLDLAGGSNSTITIWDTTTGTQLHTLVPDPDTSFLSAAFDPDGTHLATTSADPTTIGSDTTTDSNSTITIWDTTTGTQLRTLEPDPDFGSVTDRTYLHLAFDPDGTRLVTTGVDTSTASNTTLAIWDTRTGTQLDRFGPRGDFDTPSDLRFDPDGTRLAMTSLLGKVTIWDATSAAELWSVPAPTGAMQVTPPAFGEEIRLASVTDDGSITVHSTTGVVEPPVSARIEPPSRVDELTFGPDGSRLAAIDGGHVRGADRVSGALVSEFTADRTEVIDLSLDPDSSRLVTLSADGIAKIWDVESGRFVRSLIMTDGTLLEVGNFDNFGDVEYGSAGDLVAAAGDVARVWNADTGELIASFDAPPGRVEAVGFHPEGSQFVTSSDGGEVTVWDLSTEAELYSVRGGGGPIAFNRDRTLLATTNGRIWDIDTGGACELIERIVAIEDLRDALLGEEPAACTNLVD